ncbi:MAG: SDR family NAD(P)-dependent oxidoreductase [SAR324 cluster bacterium]|nr:SDR family NAD(P)-dependent oxidoreductase [SAR324 cluster bacterium]MCZ6646685.1 SDR family NAD(P)-dependent oxidoreductase [SAR324 cluster bacterium]MCZ6730098.1 SDR family NAD(P)-dependent oxidoreductase [SAR324 cluster bacterium]
MAEFQDKVVWITGAGTGIGEAAARMFAAAGAQLALLGRRLEPLQAMAKEAEGLGAKAVVVSVDVSDRSAVDAAAAKLLESYGRVDILVNNAGLNIPQRRLDVLAPEDWDAVIQANLTGAYNMVRAVLPPMRAQGGGQIINVSSMAGKRATGVSGAAYVASKHGMNGLSLEINEEEWPNGIRSTAVCPGEVNTPILQRRPVKIDDEEYERMIQPEDLAAAIRFLAALHPRTVVPEMLMVPVHRRARKPGEGG